MIDDHTEDDANPTTANPTTANTTTAATDGNAKSPHSHDLYLPLVAIVYRHSFGSGRTREIRVKIQCASDPHLFSNFCSVSAKEKNEIKCLMKLIIPRACDDLPDILKQPMNNHPIRQILSKSAPNLYYGSNYKVGRSVDGIKTVYRMAYATGSGSTSICLEPDKFQVKNFVHEHLSLIGIITSIYTRYCKQKSIHIPTTFKINAMSIKIYKSKQITRLHRDVLYDSQGNPLKNNSQVPGTPSIILSIGDDKELLFELDDKSHQKVFIQENVSVFIQDQRDEMPNDSGRFW